MKKSFDLYIRGRKDDLSAVYKDIRVETQKRNDKRSTLKS